MASPRKLLAGVVSRRREQKRLADDVKPGVLTIAKPAETAAKNDLAATDRLAGEKAVLDSHSAAVPVDPDHSEGTASAVDDRADIEDAKSAEAADPALPHVANTAARAAPKISRVGGGKRESAACGARKWKRSRLFSKHLELFPALLKMRSILMKKSGCSGIS